MARRTLEWILPVAALLMLCACGKAPAPQAAASASAATASAPTAAASGALPGDHARTARYRIDIDYPPLSPQAKPLTQALHERSRVAKQAFMKALPDPKTVPEFADRQLQLLIHYKLFSRTPAFVSVSEEGMMDTGGAHPMPLDGTFVFDVRAKRVISLDDLFVDPAKARASLAAFARQALATQLLAKVPGGDKTSAKVRKVWKDDMRQMIDAGTQPTKTHFSNFLVDAGGLNRAGGLILVFPPYQVAPYVYGVQTVKVPLKVFAGALKPVYREAFGLAP